MFIKNCKSAFTLAETLITLAIIGVVAALTIPSLVQRFQERQYVSQLKKTYAVLQNAFQMAIAEHGPIDQWGLSDTRAEFDEKGNVVLLDYSSTNLIFSYIEPYLKIASYENLNKPDKYYSLDKREILPSNYPSVNEKHNGATLADGTYFSVGWVTDTSCNPACGDLWIHLPVKKQQIGVTRFYFMFNKNGLIPQGAAGASVPFEEYCDVSNKSGITQTQQGRGCTAWALYEGNMEYLHCDDLSWGGKKKCD